jgi:2-acylglycerol O-acyltransferase 2
VYVRSRKGFVRLALRHGVPIAPAYCFGETDTYHTSRFALGLRQWLASRLTIAIPLAVGCSWLQPLLPLPTALTLYVGKPLEVGKPSPNPSEAEVDQLHERYVAALVALFDARKHAAGYGNAELEVL